MIILSDFELPALHQLVEVALRVWIFVFLQADDVGGEHFAIDMVEVEDLNQRMDEGIQKNEQIDHL
jgi:hypothetical protein